MRAFVVDASVHVSALNLHEPFHLQPLVENALRHGQGLDGSVDLAICARPQGDEAVITIADHGPGIGGKVKGCGGYGLRNVDERLRRTYGHE
ncbi:MAG TPA: hypothetical protein ENG33_08890 [Chloroflexi bacterium]|nr:hypothetical protein [Chloroflexota bacterium]